MLILKAPLNAGNLKVREGLERGPASIQEKIKDFYLNEDGMLPVLEFRDIDVDNSNLEEAHRRIEEEVSGLGRQAVLLGGDHSVTLPAFAGFAKGKENPGLVVFDAHPDLMHSFGTHEDYLRSLIERGHLNPGNIVLVGWRNADKEEMSFMKSKELKNFSMKEIAFEGKEEVCDAVMEIARGWSDLYLSIDIDVLDPAFAPGTGYREPGGMTTRELLYFVYRLKKMRNLRMADIVEVNSSLDRDGLTVSAAAKLAVELS